MVHPRPIARIGDLLGGKYKIERILGAGGVGVIAAAVHVELGQRVAVKLLRADVDQELKDRFLREARAAVQLRSEHVARVTDVGRAENGTPYFVMELLSGEDLGQLIQRGPVPMDQAVDLILQACEGLAEAHSLGMVHRDLKPRNLFLTRRVHGVPLVKLLDFGIAKVNEQNKEATAAETVFGSPQYMSPEQMKASHNVDARSDIWSLGVCLYELLAGVPPFDAPTIPMLCVKVLTEPPPSLLEKRPEVPQDLWHVIARCLAKEPSERFADVAELASALQPFAPSAHGASLRVRAVLDAPPRSIHPGPAPGAGAQDSISDTRTAGSFDTGGERSSSRSAFVVAIGSAAVVLLIGGVTIAFMTSRAPAAASSEGVAAAAPPPPAPTTPVTIPPPTSTVPVVDVTALPSATQAAPVPRPSPSRRENLGKKPDAGANPSGVF